MSTRVGVIGAGAYGELHLQVYKQLEAEGKARLVCFAAASQLTVDRQRKAFGIPGYTDYRAMLKREELDAVSIVTPDHLHREMALEAARAGKHMLVEKPLDMSVAGCTEMIKAAHGGSALLQVDFHKRYDPYLMQIKQILDDGRIGGAQYGYVHMEDLISMPTKLMRRWAEDTSPAWLLGVHMYDALRWILGCEVKKVYATGVKRALKELGIDTYDSIQAKLEFENGSHFGVDTSWIHPESFEAGVDQSVRIVGDLGVVEADLQDRGLRACLGLDGMKTFNTDYLRSSTNIRGGTVRSGYGVESIENFVENVNHILDGGKIEDLTRTYPSGEDGLAATKIAAAVHRSIAEGKVVEVE